MDGQRDLGGRDRETAVAAAAVSEQHEGRALRFCGSTLRKSPIPRKSLGSPPIALTGYPAGERGVEEKGRYFVSLSLNRPGSETGSTLPKIFGPFRGRDCTLEALQEMGQRTPHIVSKSIAYSVFSGDATRERSDPKEKFLRGCALRVSVLQV